MRLTRVYVDAKLTTGASLQLPEGPAQHLARVLRARAGDELILFNGHGGEFAAQVDDIRRTEVTVRIGAHDPIERESPLETTLLQGIARGEKMDQILQKATELGVTRVIPVATARSTVRLDTEGALRKLQHWQGVVIAASEQSGRNRIPEVGAAVALAVAVAQVQAELKVVLTPDAADSLQSLLASASSANRGRSIVFLVGPEGGLDAGEVRAAEQCGFVPCHLGPRVLRTESAALAMLAALQYTGGDLGGAPR